MDDRNILIARERYQFRKERYVERITELLEYAQSDSKCRSQFLLSYFGEKKAKRCGQCDVCLGKKGEDISKEEYSKVSKAILNLLEKEPATISNFMENLSIEEDRLISVLESMMENGKIKRSKDLKFFL
ncbi:MAG: RecQ family zinc-binding domain-containing protein [Bacteroidales bacterium]|nr:RecQ family zinc-binding domain-containing protein [Bacteroidales bacterium]